MNGRKLLTVLLAVVLLGALAVTPAALHDPGMILEARADGEGTTGQELQNVRWEITPVAGDTPPTEHALMNLAPAEADREESGSAAIPGGWISYQGKLLKNGLPWNGPINITFRLYTVSSGGAAWWTETQTVYVQNGLFSVLLGAVNPLTTSAVNFQHQEWLGIQPEGASAELTPRQPLTVAPYAMNLMPGATLVDSNPAGGYNYSLWVSSVNHEGFYAESDAGYGITGRATAADQVGVYGRSMGNGNGAHGVKGISSGTSGLCPAGITECGSALYAYASGDAYGVYVYGQNRSSLISIQGNNAYYAAWFKSLIAPNGKGLYTDGESRFDDYVTFGAGKSGYVVEVALNDGDEPLERGDVVAISGFAAPVIGQIPAPRVRKAAEVSATGMIGVVDVLYLPCDTTIPLEAGQGCGGFEPEITLIQPGQYLAVVTLGAYGWIKADASAGPIRPGDLLTASSRAGYTQKAVPLTVQGVTFYAPGTTIGVALGALDKGTGMIPVFVSVR